jgi:hypothetical protein
VFLNGPPRPSSSSPTPLHLQLHSPGCLWPCSPCRLRPLMFFLRRVILWFRPHTALSVAHRGRGGALARVAVARPQPPLWCDPQLPLWLSTSNPPNPNLDRAPSSVIHRQACPWLRHRLCVAAAPSSQTPQTRTQHDRLGHRSTEEEEAIWVGPRARGKVSVPKYLALKKYCILKIFVSH